MVSVKHFQLETPYLSAIVDNSTNIFIANFNPYHKFTAVIPRPLLRPSRKAVTIFIGRAITPRFVSVPFEILIMKVII